MITDQTPANRPTVPQRYVNLGWGNRCSLAAYVAGWKCALQLPGTMRAKTVPGRFAGGTVDDVLAALRKGMHDRINRHIPGYGVGRKWTSTWFWNAWRLSRDVNSPRLIVRHRQCPHEFRQRLAARLWKEP